MPIQIPNGLNDGHFYQIKGILKTVLDELCEFDAKRVTSRLNRSDQNVPAPVWVGIVEADDIVNKRPGQGLPRDIGRRNFRDEHRSDVYKLTLEANGTILERLWDQPPANSEKFPTAKRFGPRANCNYQRFIAIRVNNKYVGTLTVGFDHKPSPVLMGQIDLILGRWAQTNNSEYVRYLTNFAVNGPNI